MDAPSSSLIELSRLAFSTPLLWLSPETGDENQVGWISISLDETCQGDVFLLPSKEIDSELLAAAQQKGVQAVLLLGKKPSKKIKLPAGLPVALVSGKYVLKDTQRLLLTILINQRAAMHERGARIHAQLTQIEADDSGLEGLARAMAEISGKGILVQDKRGRILVECTSSALATIWQDIIQHLRSLDSLPDPLQDRQRAGSQPAIFNQDLPGGLTRLVAPIIVTEVARGYLSLIGVTGEMDALDQLVAEQGVRVCALEMSRAKAIRGRTRQSSVLKTRSSSSTRRRVRTELRPAMLAEAAHCRVGRGPICGCSRNVRLNGKMARHEGLRSRWTRNWTRHLVSPGGRNEASG